MTSHLVVGIGLLASSAGATFFLKTLKRAISMDDVRQDKSNGSSTVLDTTRAYTEKEFYPPLPEPIVGMLRLSRLCFLATQQEGEPHLSLMNFTYYQEEDIVIICTRRNTKKFAQLYRNPKVAVLIHDFPHLNNIPANQDNFEALHGKSWSITLNGTSNVIEDSTISQKYRAIHLQQNTDYSQFIVGNDIAVVTIKIEKARMCDIHDQVSYWNVKEGFVKCET